MLTLKITQKEREIEQALSKMNELKVIVSKLEKTRIGIDIVSEPKKNEIEMKLAEENKRLKETYD